MISEYDKQAYDFLKECNARISFELTARERNRDWGDGLYHNHYKVTITTLRGTMEDEFWDSAANTEKGKSPSAYDFLACMDPYIPDTFEEFCAEFGYDEDSRRAENIFRACQKEIADLHRVFTEDQLEKLAEIN